MPLTLYTHPLSGHAHRVHLFLSILGLEADLVEVDLQARAQRQPEYLRLNPFGQVPVLVDGDVTIADSNAILTYLALSRGREDWLPGEPARAAEVQRWLSVAAGELASGPGAARRLTIFRAPHGLDEAITRAHALLAIFEGVLAERPYLTGDRPTIADLANYTYVAHAPEGNVSLDACPAVRAWLGRIEALPRFVPMRVTPVGLRATA